MVNLSYASFDELRVYCTCYVYETGPWFALNIKRDKTKRNKDLKKAIISSMEDGFMSNKLPR